MRRDVARGRATEYAGWGVNLDPDTQAALDRLRALAMRARTPDEQREYDALCARLSAQSRYLAVEVWRLRDDP